MKRFAYALVSASVALTLLLLPGLSVAAADDASRKELLNARYELVQKRLRDGRLDDAMKEARTALDLARRLYGSGSANTAPAINLIGEAYRAMGRLAEAEAQLRQALDLVVKDLGEIHNYTASALNNLAGLLMSMGRYDEAEKLYLRALDIARRLPEKDEKLELDLLDNLAVLYMRTARFSDAEPILVKGVQLSEKAVTSDWLDKEMNISKDAKFLELAQRSQNLASLYFKLKRYEESEALSLKALQIYRRILGDAHPETARIKNNLGMLYSAAGLDNLAEKYLTEAIDTALGVYGKKPHQVVAGYYSDLAQHYQKGGMYAEALPFSLLAKDILMETFGRANPETVRCLNTIAVIQINLGNLHEAEIILREVLQAAQATFGEHHESLAANMSNLGSVLAALGRHREANRMFAGAISINERKRNDAFLLLSEQQKLEYTAEMLFEVRVYLSHLLRQVPYGKSELKEAMNTWLRWKGAVMEAQGRYLDAVYRSDDPAVQKRFDELVQVKRDLARAGLFTEEGEGRPGFFVDVRTLEKKKTRLEAELSNLSREFSLERTVGSVTAEKVASVLPGDAVFIDFAEISAFPYNGDGPITNHYAAFVLVPAREKEPSLSMVDLGDKERIDALVSGYVQEMKKVAALKSDHGKRQLERYYASELHDTVFKPLIPYLQGRSNLFISPDGALHLVPFEAFRGKNDRFLAEDYHITYVASGRDLLRQVAPDTVQAKGAAVLIADPDYDMGQQAAQKQKGAVTQALRGNLAKDFAGVHFGRLPDTKQEADAIAGILSSSGASVENYQGTKAVESALFGARNPGLLHIATHGYFLADNPQAGNSTRGVKFRLKENKPAEEAGAVENPMLRSGIALAGANTSLRSGSDDGLVNAEKILGLHLRGTDLVTLSACETAVGDLHTGEGVFGLKRAFLLSGAKTLVMSLWSVPSAETTELMIEFYTLMSRGVPKGKALREAKLNMMRRKSHPFFWGAFILIGKPE